MVKARTRIDSEEKGKGVEPIKKRLQNNMKSPPYDYTGEVWDAILTALAKEMAEIKRARDEVYKTRFITESKGGVLDKIGREYGISRREGESDEEYKLRIHAASLVYTSSGTLPQLTKVVALLLKVDMSEVEVKRVSDPPLTLELSVPRHRLEEMKLTGAQLVNFVDDAAMAGVKLRTVVAGDFQFTVKRKQVDSPHGFQLLDDDGNPVPDTGGKWANIIG